MRVCEIVSWRELDEAARAAVLARPGAGRSAEVTARVRRIVASVRRGGDAALRRWTRRLDRADPAELEVGAAERAAAFAAVSPAQRAAIERASVAVRAFHAAQAAPVVRVETWPGVVCELVQRPIARVGLYVPAGGAPLPSTALMLAVPAAVAGCGERVVATPPRPDGSADPAVVVAAAIAGATRVVKAGGAQAVAALAYGTASVPRVDKIFGPGNVWVTEAKRQVAADPDGAKVDLTAGPSELFVVADGAADPAWLAADLLAQAEHATDAHVLLATDDGALARAVARELAAQLAALPRREIAARALAHGRLVVTATLAEAFGVAARYAPEHLLVAVDDAEAWRERIGPAGTVYLGAVTAGAIGDYASGGNHTLPTGGAARASGGLTLADFRCATTFQRASAEGLAAIAPTVTTLARLEGLEAHARAVEVRLPAQVSTRPAAEAR